MKVNRKEKITNFLSRARDSMLQSLANESQKSAREGKLDRHYLSSKLK